MDIADKNEYNLDYNLDDYQAIIVAVGHEKYQMIIFDIKSILPNALIGASGYIAPRHMKETGNELDPYDG